MNFVTQYVEGFGKRTKEKKRGYSQRPEGGIEKKRRGRKREMSKGRGGRKKG